MFSFFGRRKVRGIRKKTTRRVGFENLEARQVMAVDVSHTPAFVNVANNVLQIVGDANNNRATVTQKGSAIEVRIESTPSNGGSPSPVVVDKIFDRSSDIHEIRFWGYEGDDLFETALNLPCTWVDGGAGDDVLCGGSGNDVLFGGTGDDILIGGKGNDQLIDDSGHNLVIGGSGTDAFFGHVGSKSSGVENVDYWVPSGSPQGNQNDCGPNSGWRVVQAYGGLASMQQLLSSTYRNSVISAWNLGTTPKTLADAMNENRRGLGSMEFEVASGKNVNDVIAQLKNGGPIVALIGSQSTSRAVEGGVGQLIDRVFGPSQNQVPTGTPKMHWIAITGYDESRRLIYFTDTDGNGYAWSFNDFNQLFKWSFDSASQAALQSQGVVPGTYIYGSSDSEISPQLLVKAVSAASWSNAMELLNALDNAKLAEVVRGLDGHTLEGVLQRLDLGRLTAIFPMLDGTTLKASLGRMNASLVAKVLPNVDSVTLRAAVDRMGSAQLLGVIQALDSATSAKVLNNCSADSLVPVVGLAPWPVAMSILNRLDTAKLNAVVCRLDGHTLGGVLQRLDTGRIIAIFPMLDGTTLKASLERMDAGVVAKVLPNVDPVTLRAAVGRMDSAQLMDVMRRFNKPTLNSILDQLDASTRKWILKRL